MSSQPLRSRVVPHSPARADIKKPARNGAIDYRIVDFWLFAALIATFLFFAAVLL